jgi:hypothetical protein
MKICRV